MENPASVTARPLSAGPPAVLAELMAATARLKHPLLCSRGACLAEARE